MRRLVIGDIHGEEEYLKEVLELAKVDKEKDLIIQIGDLCDRGTNPFKCMDILLEYKNLVLLMGNHDANFVEYIKSNRDFLGSYAANGTHTTVGAWKELTFDQKKYYIENIFNQMQVCHVTDDNILFVHGGFDPETELKKHDPIYFMWDRDLIQNAVATKKVYQGIHNFKKIYIGHTPTLYWDKTLPMNIENLWNVDTGSGKGGPLTIMDIDTNEYWQSKVRDL